MLSCPCLCTSWNHIGCPLLEGLDDPKPGLAKCSQFCVLTFLPLAKEEHKTLLAELAVKTKTEQGSSRTGVLLKLP